MNNKQYSFSEMSKKMVVNVADGRELGHACDLIFNACGAVQGLVVPGKKSLFKSITSSDSIFIPFNRIIRVGSDVILVELIQRIGTLSQDEKRSSACQDGVYSQSIDDVNIYDKTNGKDAAFAQRQTQEPVYTQAASARNAAMQTANQSAAYAPTADGQTMGYGTKTGVQNIGFVQTANASPYNDGGDMTPQQNDVALNAQSERQPQYPANYTPPQSGENRTFYH